MRQIITNEGEQPELRDDEVAYEGGSLNWQTDWLAMNDEDMAKGPEVKKQIRRSNRRRRERERRTI